MPFTGSGTAIQNATDVFFNSPAQNNVLSYNSSTAKWNNTNIAAHTIGGGIENRATATSGTSSPTINLANGNVFFYTLTASATTFAITGATAGKACSFTLYLKTRHWRQLYRDVGYGGTLAGRYATGSYEDCWQS